MYSTKYRVLAPPCVGLAISCVNASGDAYVPLHINMLYPQRIPMCSQLLYVFSVSSSPAWSSAYCFSPHIRDDRSIAGRREVENPLMFYVLSTYQTSHPSSLQLYSALQSLAAAKLTYIHTHPFAHLHILFCFYFLAHN